MIKTKEFLGELKVSPTTPAMAGEIGTWVLEYKVGKYAFDDVGSLRFAWANASDWGIPQFKNPSAPAYSSVWCSNPDVVLTPTPSVFTRPYMNSVLIQISDYPLYPGDIVRLTLGDTRFGSPGIRAQTSVETNHEFRVYVDCFATKEMTPIPESAYIEVKSNVMSKLQAFVAPNVETGKPFEVSISALDEFGNLCSDYVGKACVRIPDVDASDYTMESTVIFTESDKGIKRISATINKKTTAHIEVVEINDNIKSVSNGFYVKEKEEYTLYYGDMHGQTDLTVGIGSLDEYFTFARDVGYVQFTSWQGNDFEVDNEKWQKVREKTKEYNEENKFLVFLGYEWSGTTPMGGDHNVFFLDDNEHFYPSSNCLDRKNKTDIVHNAPYLSDLHEKLKGRNDVMTIPHIGGRRGNLDYYNPNFTPVIEIHSHHGSFEWFAMEAMKRRLKVGFAASSDDHTTKPGLDYPMGDSLNPIASMDVYSGYIGVYSKDLTKENIWEAIKARRCYATDGCRAALCVKAGEHFMGEEIECDTMPSIEVEVCASQPIDSIELYNWDKMIDRKYFMNKSKEKKVRICWRGVRSKNRKKSMSWDGSLHIKNGKILSADEYGIDRQDQGIKFLSDTRVEWTSSTSGDYDGVILTLSGDDNTELNFNTSNVVFSLPLSDIKDEPIMIEAEGVHAGVEISWANEVPENEADFYSACNVNCQFTPTDILDETNAYWVRIRLNDGNLSWSSPIFINLK